MDKRFEFGTVNLGGKHIATPFDEKNLSCDFLEDLFFDKVIYNSQKDEYMGYVCIFGSEEYLKLHVIGNMLSYRFPEYQFLDSKFVHAIVEYIEEFFKDDENTSITLSWDISDKRFGYFVPYFHLFFYCRTKE